MKLQFLPMLALAFAGCALAVDVSDVPINESMYSVLVDGSDDGTPTYSSTRMKGQVALKPAFVHSLKASAGIAPFSTETGDVVVDTTFLTSTSDRHIDHLPPNQNGYRPAIPAGDHVGFYALGTNPDAHFDADDMCVPIEEGKLIHFDGNIPHHTVIKGGSVSLIGPFHLKTMKGVGIVIGCTTCTTSDSNPGCVYHVELGNGKCSYQCIRQGTEPEGKPEPGCRFDLECVNLNRYPQCEPCTGWCRRLHTEYEDWDEALPPHRALEIIERLGANPDATYTVKHNLLSKKSCEALIEYSESSLASDAGRALHVGSVHDIPDSESSWYSFAHENSYHKKISAAELIDMIGREETLALLDFFYETKGGEDLDIDCMYLGRHGSPEDFDGEVYYAPWHVDDYTTVEVVINDDMEGGEILHLTREGIQKHESSAGTAISHGDDSVHASTPQTSGNRYMLILKHHFDRTDKPTVISRGYCRSAYGWYSLTASPQGSSSFNKNDITACAPHHGRYNAGAAGCFIL